MKKFVALLKGKLVMSEWENDDSDILWALCNVYKILGKFFCHTYLLNCLNKDT